METSEANISEETIPDSGGEGGLSAKQERALQAVISHATLKGAAEAAGVSETTLWRYMKCPAFERRLRQTQGRALAHAAVRVQHAAGEAVSVLYEIMTGADAPPVARLSAARFVFENSFRLGEIDELKKQLEELHELIRARQEEEAIRNLPDDEEEGQQR